jgi:hypothetical protein
MPIVFKLFFVFFDRNYFYTRLDIYVSFLKNKNLRAIFCD